MNNYFMSKDFAKDAADAVREAVEKADAAGLPKAYSPTPAVPQEPVVVDIADLAKKKPQDK